MFKVLHGSKLNEEMQVNSRSRDSPSSANGMIHTRSHSAFRLELRESERKRTASSSLDLARLKKLRCH